MSSESWVNGDEPFRLAAVDLSAIAHNVRTVADLVAPARVMAVVKANAYGHGALPVARAALSAGASCLGVADIAEAIALREAGITEPILAWLHDPAADFTLALHHQIEVGISSLSQLDAAARASAATAPGSGPARVHLKVDTGLGRNGVAAEEWPDVVVRAAALEHEGLVEVVGMFSHLANANPEEDHGQLARMNAAVEVAEGAGLVGRSIHLASTAAALRLPEARLSMVRLGIGLYGLSPFDDVTSAELGLRPALRVEGRVISVKRAEPGCGVSYGYTYRTEGASTLALVGLGFADGIPRLGSNRAPVWINGEVFRVSGRIAMDQFVVDVHDAEVQVGDRAVLFGDPAEGYPAVEEWAEAAETINYEIVTRLGGRFERVYSS